MVSKKKKRNRNIFLVILLVGLIVGVFWFGTQQQVFSFQFGFEPYGESTFSITDLKKISFNVPSGINTIGSLKYDSKYWDIEQKDTGGFSFFDIQPRSEPLFSGSDLLFKSATPQSKGNICSKFAKPNTETILISKEDFSKRDFKAQFELFMGSEGSINPCGQIRNNGLNIYLVGDNVEESVFDFSTTSSSRTTSPIFNLIIHPSVVDDTIEIFVNGEKTKEINYEGNYKIKISMNSACGDVCDVYTVMKNPSYKQDFGCNKKAGEQFYTSIFNEEDRVNLNKLEQFKKFCLDEQPLTIYSNIGSTTEISVLGDLVNNEEFVVPEGQIWRIDYIGDLTLFKTECEANELYNNNEDTCMSRTVLTTILEGTGETIEVETEPIEYKITSIETHQSLENNGMFRFIHAKEDLEDRTKNTFTIGDKTFFSQGLLYKGSSKNILTYPEDKNNWEVSFIYNSKEFKTLDSKIKIDDYLSVDITSIKGFFDDDTLSVEDFEIEYTFDVDTSFIETSYSEGEIIISNNYESFSGGIVLTTTDNIGTTNVKVIEKTLQKGDTKFNLDTKNLLEVKIRPFISVNTEDFNYNIDVKDGLVVYLDENGKVEEIKDISKTPIFIYIFVGIIIIMVIIIGYLFIRKK